MANYSYIVSGVLVILLLIYMLFALFKPEWF